MKQLTRILTIGIITFLLAGFIPWPEPVLAGVSEWSAEEIPNQTNSILSPAGMDIRDYAVGNDNKTIYAVPGDSVAGPPYNIFKSANIGANWAALPITIRPDLIAVAPDDLNMVAVADNATPEVYLSINGGVTWASLGTPSPAAGAVIRDIAISPLRGGKHYITLAGWKAGNIGEVWYFPYNDFGASWQETNTLPGFTAQTEVAAIAFSPNFLSDATLAAVTGNATTGVNLQLLDIASLRWNSGSFYSGYPCPVVTEAGFTRIASASLALASTFDGQDENDRNLLIGLTLDGSAGAVAASGIYRFQDTTKTILSINNKIHSLAYNGSSLAAGAFNDNAVYRIQNPFATTWTVTITNPTKRPGGDNKVQLAWMGIILGAGTGGNESAFSTSKDNAATFSDISLIDTAIANARDVAVTTAGTKIYLVTDDGADTSVWVKATNVWTRVFSLKASLDYIIRVERQNGNLAYLAQKGSTTVYTTASSGAAAWQIRNCGVNVQDIAIESGNVLYALNTAGKITRSADGGQVWSAVIDTLLTSGNMLYSISANRLLAGSQDGFIAYSLNGTSSWTKITPAFGTGKMQVVPDPNFNNNKIIYAATGTAGQDIKKWQIGVSTEWTDIFTGVMAGGIYGLTIDSNTLYAMELNAGQSTLWRFPTPLNATATSPDWVGIGVTPTTASADIPFVLNAEPQALKASTGKLWAVKTNTTGTSGNKLFSFTDTFSNVKVTLEQPQNGYTVKVNSINGIANDIVLTWSRSSVATQYQLVVALDPDYVNQVADFLVASSNNIVSTFIGPGQPVPNQVFFQPGTTYYWKVRASSPGYSLFSESRSFAVELVPVLPSSSIQLSAPANGAAIMDNTPAFSWQPLQEAVEYEFMLSDNPEMSLPLLNAKASSTAIQITRMLEAGKTYFWQVRATSPIVSEWSPLGNFYVEAAAPPPTSTESPPTVFTITLPTPTQTELIVPPADTTKKSTIPGYLVIGIIVGLALTGTVAYLIFGNPSKRTERASAGYGPARRPGNLTRTTPVIRQKQDIPVDVIKPLASVKPLAPPDIPKAAETPAQNNDLGKSKDAATVIFAARSFMWISNGENGTTAASPDKERESLGKKLAERIREFSKKEPLYIRHPEDAALLLKIWARYGSRNETNKYLADSLKSRPENAVSLLKCFIVPNGSAESANAGAFTVNNYQALAEVVDADKVYAALTRSSKYKHDITKETDRVVPADSNIISQFMRLHLQQKNTG